MHKNERAVILIVCLWILLALSIFTLSVTQSIRMNLKLAKYSQERLKALYLAKAGIIKAMAGLEKGNNNWDSLNEYSVFKDVELGEGKFTVKIIDEESKININQASFALLINICELSGIEIDLAQDLANTIINWRNLLQHRVCALAELNNLNTFKADADNLSKIQDYFRVHGEDNLININTASALVIEGMLKTFSKDNETVYSLKEKILKFREGPDGIPGNRDDGIFENNNISAYLDLNSQETGLAQRLSGVSCVKSHFFRISSLGSLNSGKTMRKIEAVIERLPISNKIEKVLYWHEN